MPHVGKPHPYPIHRDIMIWGNTPSHRMAKRYHMTWHLSPAAGGTCEAANQDPVSQEVEYLYTNVVARWKWQSLCPSAWYTYLELIFNDKLEDFKWRWSSWNAGIEYMRSDELVMTDPQSTPLTQPLNLWTVLQPSPKGPVITSAVFAEPWPP